MISISHFLILGAILFCISVAGIFLNRKNVIILLMEIGRASRSERGDKLVVGRINDGELPNRVTEDTS